MSKWKMSTYGSNESLDLGFFKLHIIYRSGTKRNPILDDERYEFRIGDQVSTKKFSSSEEAKRVAIVSAKNKLMAALQILNEITK